MHSEKRDLKYTSPLTPGSIIQVVTVLPYFLVFIYTPDGTKETETRRQLIWLFGVLAESFSNGFLVMISHHIFGAADRIALSNFQILRVDIEHIVERFGLLIVIVLGEIVIGLMRDWVLTENPLVLGESIVALIIAINIFNLYFRVEAGKHGLHALRRNPLTGVIWICKTTVTNLSSPCSFSYCDCFVCRVSFWHSGSFGRAIPWRILVPWRWAFHKSRCFWRSHW